MGRISIIPAAVSDRLTPAIGRQRNLEKSNPTYLSAQKMTTCDGSFFIKSAPFDDAIWNLDLEIDWDLRR
jgi:hypothetical protein